MASIPSETSRQSAVPASSEAGDAALIERFLAHQDAAAFEVLMTRHGPMIMGLLRRMCLQEADAEDAFQATFLTLVRKAGSIGKRDSIASWLYKVAFRIALEQRERAKKRQTKEHALTGNEQAPMEKDVAAFWSQVDVEVMQLPEKYRVPFVLCYLQGLSLERAAAQIGCPLGTVGTRLAWARNFLRSRLAKRGVVLTAAMVVTFLSQAQLAQAAPSAVVLHGTMQTALQFQSGAAVSAEVMVLSDRAVHGLFVAKAKFMALVSAGAPAVGLAGALLVPRLLQPATPPEDWLAHWGTVVDPDGDCRFSASRTILKVKVPGQAHVFAGGERTNAPRVVREVRGDFMVQVKTA